MNKLMFGLIFGILLIGMASAAITVTLNSPADGNISYTNIVTTSETASVTGGATLVNITLYDNSTGTWGARNTSSLIYGNYLINNNTQVDLGTAIGTGNYFIKNFSFGKNFNLSTINNEIYQLGSCFYQFNYANGSKVNSTSCSHTTSTWKACSYSNPNANELLNNVVLWCGGKSGTGYTFSERNDAFNVSIYNQTTFTQTFTNTYPSGSNILWNVQACDSDGACGFAISNRTFSLDKVAPAIVINGGNGTQNYGALTTNHTLNYTITDTNLASCWLQYNGTNRTIPCLSGIPNSTNFALQLGTYSAAIWANDTTGNKASYPFNWDYKTFENNRTYNLNTYETSLETYSINLTANSSLTNVYLNYNGTEYATIYSGGLWTATKSLSSSNVGTNPVYFRMVYGGTNINSDTTNQTVASININACSNSSSGKYINFSFIDESTNLPVNSQITSMTLNYKLSQSSTVSKTLTYSNTTEVPNYYFCASPSNLTYYLNYSISYKNGTTYPQRISEISTTAFTNATTNTKLYLLSSSYGIYVTFQLTNSADQLISGVNVNATRVINGVTTVVAVGTTSASGTVTFWLNPDALHTFTFSKSGYTTYTYQDYPTQASYTVILSTTSTQTQYDYTKGITKRVYPSSGDLVNGTVYNFNLTLASTYWDVSEFGFYLYLSNGTILSSTSSATNGGFISANLNTSNYTRIYINYYYVVNGTYMNDTTYWNTFNGQYTGWSIKTFFDDLKLYMDDGMFGIDDFGRYVIIFLVLFISVGIMSYKFGTTSPMGMATILFAVVFFFDFVLGLIPNPVGFIANAPTWLSLIILIGVILSENLR
jgi:hypothetical protein